MTRAVGLDTSTWWGGVALVEAGEGEPPVTVAEAGLLVRDSHAVHLLALLDALLEHAGWTREVVDLWATSRGPGSFTGLRVGLGTIAGLGLASVRPCLGIGTLDAMAEAVGPSAADRVPLLDAGRGEVFGARYDRSSSPPVERVAPWLGPPERALAEKEPAIVFGSGARSHRDRLLDAGLAAGVVIELVPDPASVAAAVARLAIRRLEAGAPGGEGMSPLYLRPADAELHTGRT